LRLSKLINVSWITAHRMLRKFRMAMGDQNKLYKLKGVIELDDALIGGKRSGKRGRGAEGKTAVLVACEHNNGKPGFVVMKAVDRITHSHVKQFSQEVLETGQTVHTDAFASLSQMTWTCSGVTFLCGRRSFLITSQNSASGLRIAEAVWPP